MRKNKWIEWIKCNILEIIILILVLTLVINTFSKKSEIGIQEKEEVSTMEQPQEDVQEEIQPGEEVSEKPEGAEITEEVPEETVEEPKEE